MMILETRIGGGNSRFWMNAIQLLAETAEAVTIGRSDLDALIDAAENAEDIASVRAWKAYVAAVGRDAAIANSYTGAEAKRLLDGESPVRIWRDKRGMTRQALAAAAAIPTGYLREIENRGKPGSVAATAHWQRRLPCRWRILSETSDAEAGIWGLGFIATAGA